MGVANAAIKDAATRVLQQEAAGVAREALSPIQKLQALLTKASTQNRLGVSQRPGEGVRGKLLADWTSELGDNY